MQNALNMHIALAALGLALGLQPQGRAMAAGAAADHAGPAACERAASVAAAEFGVPPDLMLAVAVAESGRLADGRLQPWPWAVNVAGRGHWFATRTEAEAHVAEVLASGRRNVDLGCFQINHRWHADRFESVSAMFDPLRNARHAAAFLASLHEESGDWDMAVGHYHSRTPHLAERYRARIAALRDPGLLPESEAPERRPNGLTILQVGPPGAAGSLVPARSPATPILRIAPGPLLGG